MIVRRLAVLAACAVVTSVLSVPSITPAAAGVGETLYFRDMVVDTVRDRFYVAGAGDIGVYDSGAGSLGPVSGTSQTVDLAVSADSSRVVATRPSANEIVVIDTLSRSVLRRYPVPSTYCLFGASAPVHGRVWFTHECSEGVVRGLSAVDLTTGAITDGPTAPDCGYPTDLVTSPTAPHLLFANCAQRLTRLDLSTSPPSSIESADLGTWSDQLAVTADGSQVLVGTGQGVLALRTTDLAQVARYGTTGGPAVATSPAGGGLVAVLDFWASVVVVYRVGSATPLTTYPTPALGYETQLALSADGRHVLVASSSSSFGAPHRLGVVPAQTAPPSPVVPIRPAGNGRIAFRVAGTDQWASVLPDGTGRQVRPVDAFEGVPQTLTFSPDGSEVAMSTGFASPRIVLGEPEGGFPWKVTNYDSTRPQTRDIDPVFSPAGGRVLFQRTASTDEIWSTDLYDRFPRQQPGTELKAGLLAASQVSVAPDGGLVWQVEEGASFGDPTEAAIWYLAPTPGATAIRLTNGSSPEIGPDGRTVLFVRWALDDTTQVFVVKTDGTGGAQVTTGTDAAAPAWAPDGSAIAFHQNDAIKILDLTTRETRVLAKNAERPAWQPLPAGHARDVVLRLGGADRIETAIEVSRSGFPTAGSAGAAVLARSDGFADALVGTPLATAKHGPLLLTPATALDARVKAEIVRAVPAGGTVYLLGGVGALSQRVADQVTATGRRVVRLQGVNRYATAVAVAKALGPVDVVLLATGNDFPDALTAGAAAGSYFYPGGSLRGGAVLLTNGTVMPQEVTAYLAAAKPTTLAAIGGPAAKAAPKATPIVGDDRYDTSVRVAYAFFGPQEVIGLASGTGFADALPGGTLLAYVNGPLLLTAPTGLPLDVDYYLHTYSSAIHTAVVLGGTGAISTSLQRAVTSTIGVTTRYQVGGSLAGTLAPGTATRTATRTAASRAVPEVVTPDKPSRPTQRPSLSVPAG